MKNIAAAPSLRSLFIRECTGISTLVPFSGAKQLECLAVEVGAITNYEIILSIKWLRILSVDGEAFSIWDLLDNRTELERLRVWGCAVGITSIEDLCTAAPNLRSLHMRTCPDLSCVGAVKLRYLTLLSVEDCQNLRAVDATGLDQLDDLHIWGCSALDSIRICSSVERFSMYRCRALTDVDMSHCERLEYFTLSDCTSIVALLLPEDLSSLEVLALVAVPARVSLDLRSATQLEDLSLECCPQVVIMQMPATLLRLSSVGIEERTLLEILDLRTSNLCKTRVKVCNSVQVLYCEDPQP